MIQSPNSNASINTQGINIQQGHLNDNVHELIANEYNVVVANHELTPTTDTWMIPNTTTTVADIENMDWWQRHRLINDVQAGGNVLSFRSTDFDADTEEYTDVLYNNRVVCRIDQRHLNQVSITDNIIMITNPHTSLILSNHDIKWMRNYEQAQQQRLSDFISSISNRIEQLNLDVAEQVHSIEWLLDHPTLTDRHIVGIGSRILVPLVDAILYIPCAICEANSAMQIHESKASLLSSSSKQIDFQPLIDWCISNESDISIPDDTNEAISLNSCIHICKTFRDTVKGQLALLSYKLKLIGIFD